VREAREQPEPFVRGCAYTGVPGVAYPRADPADAERLPQDTWAAAKLPVTVRLEMVGDAGAVELAYRTETSDLGYRGEGAGRTFMLWRAGRLVDEAEAALGEGVARLSTGGLDPDVPSIVYLPEGMRPAITSLRALEGSLEPAPRQPRWIAYGDSVAEGWVASSPCFAWPALVGRDAGLDVVNMGYAGAARGEIASAEQIARIPASVISVSHGTNCWARVPFSRGMMLEGTRAFLEVLRQGHPGTPIVVASPVVRPDAEETPNRLGATLDDLRAAIEQAVAELIERGDRSLALVKGRGLVSEENLADGIHPGDSGHREIAAALGPAICSALGR
jgi:lysophospholipase L1-like esterase